MAVPQKFEHGVTYDPAIPFLSIYPRKVRTCPHTCTCTQAAQFIIAKRQKQLKCPSADEWECKLSYSYNGILFNNKKELTD